MWLTQQFITLTFKVSILGMSTASVAIIVFLGHDNPVKRFYLWFWFAFLWMLFMTTLCIHPDMEPEHKSTGLGSFAVPEANFDCIKLFLRQNLSNQTHFWTWSIQRSKLKVVIIWKNVKQKNKCPLELCFSWHTKRNSHTWQVF